MVLSKRLELVYDMCKGTRRVIDVGCDHAQLAIRLAQDGAFVFASDINRGPLERAESAVRASGLEGQIKTVLCDGLSAFSQEDADTIVIAGLGGETIADILARAPWALCKKLVLQPMSKADKLRRFLSQNGCRITEERLVREDAKLYCVLAATCGDEQDLSGNFWLFSDRMKGDPLFPQYIDLLLNVHRSVAFNRARGGHRSPHADAVVNMLTEIKHVL